MSAAGQPSDSDSMNEPGIEPLGSDSSWESEDDDMDSEYVPGLNEDEDEDGHGSEGEEQPEDDDEDMGEGDNDGEGEGRSISVCILTPSSYHRQLFVYPS
jgi:hypothetical protein